MRRIAIFTDKYPLVGPFFWAVTIQYVIVQIIVAAFWHNPAYSWLHNAISDLGATLCGQYSGRAVCSPLFPLMNASFVLLGITMVAGSILIYQEFRKSFGSRLGFTMMALAGIGVILVGLFPENEVPVMHGLGALLAFLLGDVAMVVFGFSLFIHPSIKLYSIASGIISLSALGLYSMHQYLGFGLGGMERLAGYPQTLWLILFGIYMTRPHFRKIAKNIN